MEKNRNNSNRIPTYVINLKERSDRLEHIKQQFSDKPQFEVFIFKALTHPIGAVGLWESTLEILRIAEKENHEYILICEDDHQFTDKYAYEELRHYILEGNRRNADILLGGVHWFNSVMKVVPCLFWIDKFTATQFLIVYRRFFRTILESTFELTDISDLKISELTDNKLVIYPFISIQKEFGYSDVTEKNSKNGYLNYLFNNTSSILGELDTVREFYDAIPLLEPSTMDIDHISVQTYILCRQGQTETINQIKQQFENKKEFDTTIVELGKQDIDVSGGYNCLKAICLAEQDKYDVVVVCQDNHKFTDTYSWEFLLRNILEAHQQGADLLYVGAIDFGLAVPITTERFWINQILSTPFVIVYKRFFPKILRQLSGELTIANLSLLTENKMLIWSSISIVNPFSSVKNVDNDELNILTNNMIAKTDARLTKLKQAYLKLNDNCH